MSTRPLRSLLFVFLPAMAASAAYVGQWLQRFKEFPPRRKPGGFNLERAMEAVIQNHGGGR